MGGTLRRRMVVEPAEHLKSKEDGKRSGELTDEILDTIINHLVTVAGVEFVPFDHVRECVHPCLH